ncbi:MAG: thioredoxin [Thermoguttaceae bacterium]|jgi:thioredoxin 1
MKAKDLSEADFDSTVLNATVPVLVDFWSPTCGPCRALAPVMDRLADEFGDEALILKVDLYDNMNLAQRFNVESIPTILLFKDGNEVARLSGNPKQEKLSSLIREHQ